MIFFYQMQHSNGNSGCDISFNFTEKSLYFIESKEGGKDQKSIQSNIMEQILFYHIWRSQTLWASDLNNLMNNPSNSPVISEKQTFR